MIKEMCNDLERKNVVSKMSAKVLLLFYQVAKHWDLGKNILNVTTETKETEYCYVKQEWEIKRTGRRTDKRRCSL
jgi:hypothetical protein